jgi:hypothetical protein
VLILSQGRGLWLGESQSKSIELIGPSMDGQLGLSVTLQCSEISNQTQSSHFRVVLEPNT